MGFTLIEINRIYNAGDYTDFRISFEIFSLSFLCFLNLKDGENVKRSSMIFVSQA